MPARSSVASGSTPSVRVQRFYFRMQKKGFRRKVLLVGDDSNPVEVDREIAVHAPVIKRILADCKPPEGMSPVMRVPCLDQDALILAMQYCDHHRHDKNLPKCPNHGDNCPKALKPCSWDTHFLLHLNRTTIAKLSTAGNKLQLKALTYMAEREAERVFGDLFGRIMYGDEEEDEYEDLHHWREGRRSEDDESGEDEVRGLREWRVENEAGEIVFRAVI